MKATKAKASASPKEQYFSHLTWRLQRDRDARATRALYHRLFNGWVNECQRLNGGVFAWPPRY